MNNQRYCCLGHDEHVKSVITSLAAAAHYSWRHMQQRLQCRRHYLFRQGRKSRIFRVGSVCDDAVGAVLMLNRRSSSLLVRTSHVAWLNEPLLFHHRSARRQNYSRKRGSLGDLIHFWRGKGPAHDAETTKYLKLHLGVSPPGNFRRGDLQICLLLLAMRRAKFKKKCRKALRAALYLLPAARKAEGRKRRVTYISSRQTH